MPEPLSIATGVVSLVFSCMRSLDVAKSYITKYELKILQLRAETSALHLALEKIRDLFVANSFSLSPSWDASGVFALHMFENIFGQCHLTFSILKAGLNPLLSITYGDNNTATSKSKILAVWKSGDIDLLISLLQGLTPAVQLILTAFQTFVIGPIPRIWIRR